MKRIAGLLLVLGISQAYAHSDKQPVPASTKWKEECSSCHVAYPPELLAADNWQTLMGKLDRHFGANASLNAQDNKKILGYLLSHAGSGKQYTADSLRISDTIWFRHRHRSIAPAEWTNPSVRSRSNCNGCHGKTVLGDGY
jgi:hypothetical protein